MASVTATPLFATEPASAARAESASTFRLGSRLIDGESASAEFLAIKLSNGLGGRVVVRHFNEPEAARLARVAVCHDPHLLHFAESTEQIPEFVFSGGKRKVAYEKVLHLFPHRVEISCFA
jgi:hypothetical protein